MASSQPDGSSYFGNPRSGIDTFHVIVSRIALWTVAVGAAVAAVLVAFAHVYFGSGSNSNWLFLAVCLGLAILSWRESRRDRPRSLVPLIGMLALVIARLLTADLFVAVALLLPFSVVGLMGAFSLADRDRRVFNWIFLVGAGLGSISYVIRFDNEVGVWRGIVAAGVGAVLGAILVSLIRRENRRFVSRYETLYDEVSMGLIRISAQGQLLAANRTLARMLGYESASDLEAVAIRSILFEPSDFDSAAELVRTGRSGEIILRHRDGSRLWVRITFNEVEDATGAVLGYEGFVEDVTESRQARQVARRAEARFRTVFESAPIGMALVGNDGLIVRANGAFSVLAGYEGSVPAGTPWETILGGQLGDSSRLLEPRRSDEVDQIEVVSSGHDRRCLRLHVERSNESEPDGGFAIVQVLDVTSDVELQSVLREQVRAKNDFIATVSHELRTPLTAVVGFLAELPASLGEVERGPAEMLDIATSEATSLSNIVEDLLVAARAEVDQLAITTENVAVADVVARVVRASSRVMAEHGASVDTSDVVPELAVADEGRVEQIVRNLIMNAARHGGTTIAVGTERCGDLIEVRVSDDGPGIPADIIDSVFEPFRSFGADRGLTTSMGLGLYVAHSLAQRMGGSIGATSRPGVTEFVLALPAAGAPAVRVASA